MSKTSEYYPKEQDGKWYATYKYQSDFNSRIQENVFKDLNGDKLEFLNEEHCSSWCDVKNEIDKTL